MLNIDSTTRSIYDLVSSGGAIDTSFVGEIGGASTALNGVVTQLQNVGDSSITPIIDQLQGTVGGALTSFQSHVTDQFSNLGRNLSLYTGDFSLRQGLGSIPGFPSPSLSGALGVGAEASPQSVGDICKNVNSFFGSIIGQGRELIEGIVGQISALVRQATELARRVFERAQAIINGATEEVIGAINAAIGAVTRTIRGVVNEVAKIANEVTDMIRREVQELADALKRALNFTDAVSYRSLFNHPCAKTVLGAVGTGGLVAVLTQVARR
jgi:phage-related protein